MIERPASMELSETILGLLDIEVLVVDRAGGIVFSNERARAPAGRRPEDSPDSSFADCWNANRDGMEMMLRQLAGSSTWQAFSLVDQYRAGEAIPLRGRGFRTKTTEGPAVHILVMRDSGRGRQFREHRQLIQQLNAELSRRRRAEQSLVELLAAQKRVHRELVHRVKNNLTLLISLIFIGKRRCDTETAREQFDQLERRVMSIAKIHQLLDNEPDARNLAADKLLQQIGRELSRSLAPPTVKIECDLIPVRLHISEATALGLIVNELATNAVKHAFPGGRQGRVLIGIKAAADSQVTVTVVDDGIGMAEGAARQRGSGSTIVQALAGQLGADLTHAVDGGTSWTLSFKPGQLDCEE